MKRFLRPSTLIVLLVLLVVGAAVWVFVSTRMPSRPAPLPVPKGDQEIAWLNAATASTSWQRFVQAVAAVTKAEPGPEAYPRGSTLIPEIAISIPGQAGKLRIRWYKLTSEYNAAYWMEALAKRDPPPLAIIGGNTTDAAAEQARRLSRAVESLDEARRPLLLLTTATADRVPSEVPAGEPLLGLYPKRSFRFCFSNRQMGETVTRFVWSRPELRPEALPIHTCEWNDDPYSADLVSGFVGAASPLVHRDLATGAAGDCGFGAGFAAAGGFPLAALTVRAAQPGNADYPLNSAIPFSVGDFMRPTRHEAEEALVLFDHYERHPPRRRALLVLSGQSGPSRRFLRAMCRLSPIKTRRFVVATGDAISFNTIVRDRNVTWPIQDLPCNLVLFCHNNPVGDPDDSGRRDVASGTEDLLLNQDIVQALMLAATRGGGWCADADELRAGLTALRIDEGTLTREDRGSKLFTDEGGRSDGTGEHVVWLRPKFDGERVEPRAEVTVVAWQPQAGAWRYRGDPFPLAYTGARTE